MLTYDKQYVDPKGHRIPDNYRQISRLRDKANWAAGKSRRSEMVTRVATKVLGGMAARQEAGKAAKLHKSTLKSAASKTFGGIK